MTTLREKILAAAVLGLLLLWGGGKMWGRYNDALATKRSALVSARAASRRREVCAREGADRQEASRRLASTLAARRPRSRPVGLPRLARKQLQAGRAHDRRHPTEPATRPGCRLFGDRLHSHRPRFAQVARCLSARILSQHAAAANHAVAVAAGDRSETAQHHAANRGADSCRHLEPRCPHGIG